MSSRRVLVATHFCSQLRGRALASLAMFGIMLLTTRISWVAYVPCRARSSELGGKRLCIGTTTTITLDKK